MKNKLIISADAFNFKGILANKEDFLAVSTTEDQAILITLKEIKRNGYYLWL